MGLISEFLFGKDEYKYYDTPDGEDCLKKILYVTKYGTAYGLMLSSLDILLISHPKGYPQVLTRYAAVTLPFVGMGVAFASTSCISTNLRQKDDQWNHAFGGASVGGVIGACMKSVKVGSYSAIFLGFAALVVKDIHMRGWSILELDHFKKTTNPDKLRIDWRVTSEPKL